MEHRRFYAEEIRAAAALPEGPATEHLLDAFAAVPREDHVGPGPWLLRSALPGMRPRRTPDADPRHLYHKVLIALNEERGINIGEPSLWARLLLSTGIPHGAHVLQVGAGSGYYTAILAELVGVRGHVTATEIDPALARMAARALAGRPNVTLHPGNGAVDGPEPEGAYDLIVAFAGVTHPAPRWLRTLKPDGQMLLPVTGPDWWGAMVLFRHDGDALVGQTLGRCGFFPCQGARDDQTAQAVADLWSDPGRLNGAEIELKSDEGRAEYTVRPASRTAPE